MAHIFLTVWKILTHKKGSGQPVSPKNRESTVGFQVDTIVYPEDVKGLIQKSGHIHTYEYTFAKHDPSKIHLKLVSL